MGSGWSNFVGAITSREFISLIVGLMVVAAAVYLGSVGAISGQEVITLLLIGLAIAGFGRFRSRNFEVVLSRALRAGRKVEPIIIKDDARKVIKVYTKYGKTPRGLVNLVKKLGKLAGYDVVWNEHGGLSLLLGSELKVIDEVPEFHGPEYSGKDVTYYAGVGPKYWFIEVWHVKFLATRVIISLAKAKGGIVWSFDFVLKEGERKNLAIPIPNDDEYVVIINSVAFRETPGVIGYKIVEKEVPSLPVGKVFAFTTFADRTYTWPQYWFVEPKDYKQKVEITNVSDYVVRVSYTRFYKEFTVENKEVMLESGEPYILVLEPLFEGVEIRVSERNMGFGYVVVSVGPVDSSKRPPTDDRSPLNVMSGDEIRPDNHSWVGSLGYQWRGYLLTNAHVAPYNKETVYHTRSGRSIGVVTKVAKIRTVGPIDILMNIFFGRPLPVNKVDAAAIKPEPYVQYSRFMRHRDELVEVREGDMVWSRGRTSGERSGTVKNTNASVAVPWPHDGKVAIFTDCLLLEMAVGPGDSGSAVVTHDGIVGLVFAGDQSGRICLVIKGTNIEKWLESIR